MNRWHFYTVVFNGINDIRLYVDGDEYTDCDWGTGTGSSLGYSGSYSGAFGMRYSCNKYVNNLHGKLDDTRVYNNSLSETQIDSLYHFNGWSEFNPDLFTYLTSHAGSEYYVSKSVDTWQNAKNICEQNGGHLITISNSDENAIAVQGAETTDNGRVWIGFTDEETEGTWEWITGEAVTYTNWYPDQPDNNGGDEHYAIVYDYRATYPEQWGDNRNTGSHDLGRCFVLELPAEFSEKSLSLLSPSSAEFWAVGSRHEIRWDCSNVESIDIEYWYEEDGAYAWIPITSNFDALKKSYEWAIPTIKMQGCKIRISDSDNYDVNDESDPFDISPTTTIITHGFTLDTNEPAWEDYLWQFSMAEAITEDVEILFLRRGIYYKSNIAEADYTSIDRSTKIDDVLMLYFDQYNKTADVELSDEKNLIIIFDWAEESNWNTLGFAEAAADVLSASLINLGRVIPWTLRKLHFIGHSRGAVVNSEAIQRLIYFAGQNLLPNVVRDSFDKKIHMTTLDPHPASHWSQEWTAFDLAYMDDDKVNSPNIRVLDIEDEKGDYVRAAVVGWVSNNYCVKYIDNYYHPLGTVGWASAAFVRFRRLNNIPGLKNEAYISNVNLDLAFDYWDKRRGTHGLVKTWYYGTIDHVSTYDIFDTWGNEIHRDRWYIDNIGETEGFMYSLNGKGEISYIESITDELINVKDDQYYGSGKLIFNGNFFVDGLGYDDGYGQNKAPGWSFQGGSGDGHIKKEYLELDFANTTMIHNPFYISGSKLYFYVKVDKKSNDDVLQISFLNIDNSGEKIIKEIYPTTRHEFPVDSVDISEFNGSVRKLKFELKNRDKFGIIDSEIRIDNISFKRKEGSEVSLSSNSGASKLAKGSSLQSDGGCLELHAYDSQGNHTGQINDSTWITEIPGSNLFIDRDSNGQNFQEIHLPNSPIENEFTILVKSNGTMANANLQLRDYSVSESAVSASFENIIISANGNAKVNFTQVDTTIKLNLDDDSDGIPENILKPTKFLSNYIVDIEYSTGGSVTPSGLTYIVSGDSVVFNFIPDSGYAVYRVIVDSVDLGIIDSYTINSINKDHHIFVEFQESTRIDDKEHKELSFNLVQNYPNPFNPQTTIRYTIPSSEFVSITVYNLLGQKVKQVVKDYQSAGEYSVQFNGSDLPSGIYYYMIQAGEFTQVKKMVLLK